MTYIYKIETQRDGRWESSGHWEFEPRYLSGALDIIGPSRRIKRHFGSRPAMTLSLGDCLSRAA